MTTTREPGPAAVTRPPVGDPVSSLAFQARLLPFIAGFLAAIAVIIGIVMAAARRVIECPDGTTLQHDADKCYSHPHAGLGASIALMSAALLLLILLVGMIADAVARHLVPAGADDPPPPSGPDEPVG